MLIMKCMGTKDKKKTIDKTSYSNDIYDILNAIIKHQNLEDDTEFPISHEETLGILEANLVWVMENVDIPFEQWKALFKNNPKYLKRLSDISMTYSFESMVKSGEAVELQAENPNEKPIYMKKEDYEMCVGVENEDQKTTRRKPRN